MMYANYFPIKLEKQKKRACLWSSLLVSKKFQLKGQKAARCQEGRPGTQALGEAHCLASVPPWAGAFPSLSLDFPIYKMGVTTGPTTPVMV